VKTKSLLLVAVSVPTLAFAQNNYQTQYITGTYFDQANQYSTTSGEYQRNADAGLQQTQLAIDKQGSQGQVANTQDRMNPSASPQNINEPTPRMGR
jgi:hypothetical protein